jgi:hypothetical protein
MESAVTVLSGAQIGALLADIEQMPLDADPRAWPDAALRAAVAIRQLRAEIYEAHVFLTGKGEMAYFMTHPRDEPDTELGKAAKAHNVELFALRAERHRLAAQLEQLQVQLAGCGAAALGATKEPAMPEMYGWSPAYQSVLDLRMERDAIVRRIREHTFGDGVVECAADELLEGPHVEEAK